MIQNIIGVNSLNKQEFKHNIVKLVLLTSGESRNNHSVQWTINDMDETSLLIFYDIMKPIFDAVKEEENKYFDLASESDISIDIRDTINLYAQLSATGEMIHTCQIIINDDEIGARIDIDDGYLQDCTSKEEIEEIAFNWSKDF
jgi:hypothetical protein